MTLVSLVVTLVVVGVILWLIARWRSMNSTMGEHRSNRHWRAFTRCAEVQLAFTSLRLSGLTYRPLFTEGAGA